MRKETFRLLKYRYNKKLEENGQGLRVNAIKYNAVKETIIDLDILTEKEITEMESDLEMAYRVAQPKV